jgi:hypothetical protein
MLARHEIRTAPAELDRLTAELAGELYAEFHGPDFASRFPFRADRSPRVWLRMAKLVLARTTPLLLAAPNGALAP